MSYLHISTATALTCTASAGGVPDARAKELDEIIDVSILPPAFLEPDFKQFRIATKKVEGKKIQKISINVDPDAEVDADTKLGQYMCGNLNSRPLYSIAELRSFGSVPNADCLQFVPAGTSYSVLDFDSDKSLSNEERSAQVDYVINKIMKQFEGTIEMSTSGLGFHAYIKDKRIDNLPKDPYAVGINLDGIGKLSFEMFAGNAPIVLTGNIIEKADASDGVGTLPKPIMKLIDQRFDKDVHTDKIEPSTVPASEVSAVSTSTEEKTYAVVTEDEDRAITERFEENDKDDRLNVGYGDSSDCSNIDFFMAVALLRHSDGNVPFVIERLSYWMTKWRPTSNSPIKKTNEDATAKEIARLAELAVKGAYKRIEKTEPNLLDQWQEQAQEEKPKSIKEKMMELGKTAEDVLQKASKSQSLAWNIVYNGTMNTFFANSGAGKTKISVVTAIEIAKTNTEKFVYYYAPDLSIDDLLEMRKLVMANGLQDRFIIDQDSRGDEFISMMDTYGKSDDIGDVVFIIDTIKKVFPVNDKLKSEKGFAILRRCVSRGATGIAVAHTLKDGVTLAGVAEFSQDVDNVLWVEKQYIGEDKLKSTLMPSPDHRCRSRISPMTFLFDRDGFGYEVVADAVDNKSMEYALKHENEKGNLVDVAVEIVEEYFGKKDELPKSSLFEELRRADTYTGTKTTIKLKALIDGLEKDGFIHFEKKGRTNFCLPISENGAMKVLEKVVTSAEETSTEEKNDRS